MNNLNSEKGIKSDGFRDGKRRENVRDMHVILCTMSSKKRKVGPHMRPFACAWWARSYEI